MLKNHLKKPKIQDNIQRRSFSLVDPYKVVTNPKVTNNKINPQVQFTSINKLEPPTPSSAVQTISNKTQSGLNRKFLQSRRQNFLNTGYNSRKHRLQNITAQNKQIHGRINSQKSSYSREQMKKSYDNSCSISRRLSQSKISQRSQSSSRASIRSNNSRESSSRKQRKFLKPRLAPKKYQLNAKNITTLPKDELQKMGKIFNMGSPFANQNTKPYSSSNKRNHSISVSKKQQKSCLKTVLPPIAQQKRSSHIIKNPLTVSNDGDFLHRIAQQMYIGKK